MTTELRIRSFARRVNWMQARAVAVPASGSSARAHAQTGMVQVTGEHKIVVRTTVRPARLPDRHIGSSMSC